MLATLQRPALGIRVRVQGRERLRAERPCIYVANHQSILDVPILAELYDDNSVVVAKKELRGIPLFGWIYLRAGNLLIDRGDTADSVARLREAEAEIRRRRVGVWIFPEGTRGPGDGTLLPFKKGAFRMAVATSAPLVPVVVGPLKPHLDMAARRLGPHQVEVRVLPAISVSGLGEADLPELMQRTHAAMQDAILEMREGAAP